MLQESDPGRSGNRAFRSPATTASTSQRAESFAVTPQPGQPHPGLALISATPKRVSVTLPLHVYRLLESRSVEQGRSMSNLAAFLIEAGFSRSVADQPADPMAPQAGPA